MDALDTSLVFSANYFPGCSQATTAQESQLSMMLVCTLLGIKLDELPDWNCCGSSSAHALDEEIAMDLPGRILTLCPDDRPLVVSCPNCLKTLKQAQYKFKQDPVARASCERRWDGKIDTERRIIHFLQIFELLDMDMLKARLDEIKGLNGLKIAPYYGCSRYGSPTMDLDGAGAESMDGILTSFGAELMLWPEAHLCCGTFLSVTRPKVAENQVNRIMQGAVDAGAECIVTACAMCQLNVELRCTTKTKLPMMHFTEMMALALGATDYQQWFSRHIVSPKKTMRSKEII